MAQVQDAFFWEGLVANGTVTQEQLDVCMQQHRHQIALGVHSDLSDILQRNLFASAASVKSYLQEKGISSSGAGSAPLLPPGVCLKYRVVPLRVQGDTLIVESARSLDYTSKLMLLAACPAKPAQIMVKLVDLMTMRRALARLGEHRSFDSQIELVMRGDKRASDLKSAIEAMLHEAIDRRSSDIHLDRKADPEAFISLRIDSQLQQSWIVREAVMGSIFSRLKTLSGMDASESRRAQDGRMQIEHRGRTVSFRLATLPIVNGETMAIRVIDAAMLPSPVQLFPNQPEMHRLVHAVANADGKGGGLMLITGATGSGKSTTLYSVVSAMPRDRRNVITVEDPVEFILPFCRQVLLNQLLEQKATDFERAVLRQDPDVLVFGEIRDADSARAALKFAESGHFVLASLHSKTASQAVERLLSIIGDGERSEAALVIAETLVAVLHQKLVPRLCECAELFTDDDSFGPLAAALGSAPPPRRWRPVGCPKCEGHGYRGRTLMHETLIFDADDDGRHALTLQLMRAGSLKGMANPVHHTITRNEVATALLSEGVIDDQIAIRALRDAFNESALMEAP